MHEGGHEMAWVGCSGASRWLVLCLLAAWLGVVAPGGDCGSVSCWLDLHALNGHTLPRMLVAGKQTKQHDQRCVHVRMGQPQGVVTVARLKGGSGGKGRGGKITYKHEQEQRHT